jgi:hypothetical protein
MSTPSAELRVYYSRADRHALVFNVEIAKRGDVYVGAMHIPGKQVLKQSWHASGKSHMHTPADRHIHKPKVPPGKLQEPHRLMGSSFSPELRDWSYQPRERARRMNISIDLDRLGPGVQANVDLWAIPSIDHMPSVLAFYKNLIVLGHVVMDWSTPNLVVVVWDLTPGAVASLYRSLREDQEREGS